MDNELIKAAFENIKTEVGCFVKEKGWNAKEEQIVLKMLSSQHIFTVEEIHIVRNAFVSQKLMLMVSELSEALEGLRHGNPPSDHIPEFSSLEEELADVSYRIAELSNML